MKKAQVLKLSIARMGLTTGERNSCVKSLVRERDPDFDFGVGAKRRKLQHKLAEELTVEELVTSINAGMRKYAKDHRIRDTMPFITKSLSDKLMGLGLTQADVLALPSSTVATAMLQRMGKKKVQQLSVFVLGTLSFTAIQYFAWHLDKNFLDLTIQDLLRTSPLVACPDWMGGCSVSMSKTRQKLKDIGFRYEDGIFLQAGTKRQLVEELMKSHSISRKMACTFAEIAHARGMVKDFIE